MRTTTLICLFAAACTDAHDVQTTAQPIVNGTVDTGDPATVYLSLGGGGCTGTLVTPKTVLTAKHCLSSSMKAFFGTYSNGQGTWINVVHKSGHSSADIAMLTLASAGPPPPVPMNGENLANYIGQPIRIAGFGVTSENGGGSGTKRQGMAALDSVDGGIMYATNTPSGTCYGDSGGPNFMTINNKEVLIGVTSFGTEACGAGLDGSVRVDTYRTWIDTYIEAHDPQPKPTCDGDGLCASGCTVVDPDCPCAADGFCDAACSDIGSDPDCSGCLAGDVCRMDCPMLDDDCCASDGGCNTACGIADLDCGPDGDGNPDNDPKPEDPGEGGGCATGGGGSLLSLLLFLGLCRSFRWRKGAARRLS